MVYSIVDCYIKSLKIIFFNLTAILQEKIETLITL
jgi:hypothetical protein